jgi:dTDP-4-dehydrorhamnose 3,5-epimerase-like enzyme
MSEESDSLWQGLRREARGNLSARDYSEPTLEARLCSAGMEAGEVLEMVRRQDAELAGLWIPGVRLFPRKVFVQRHRGFFGELGREHSGIFEEVGFWPCQWSAATMYAGTSKGFHVHPPHIPAGEEPAEWFGKLYGKAGAGKGFAAPAQEPPVADEQWDVMFFPRGRVEVFLIDERAGLARRRLRFWIDGDNHRGPHNAGLVIPPGVAHALRVEGSEDALMVYGTTTTFRPEFEGRICSGIETARLPPEWKQYFEEDL